MRLSHLTLYIASLLAAAMMVSCSTARSTSKSNKYPEEKLGWKLGAQAYTFRLFSFEEALSKIDSAGLRHVEIYQGQPISTSNHEKMGHRLSKEGKAAVKKLLAEKKITVNAYGVVNGNDEKEWEEIFQFAQELSIPVIVSEPKETHLDIISRLCDQYNIKVALHNHPNPSHYWTPDVVLAAMKGRSDKIGAGADVGHWIRSGLDPVESLKKLEGRIYHIHFKDLNVFGDKKAHDVHWGTGVLGLSQVIEELKRQKFTGMISAEYEYNWQNNMEDVKASAANFRNTL